MSVAGQDYLQMSGDRLHDIGYAGLATLLAEDRQAAVTER